MGKKRFIADAVCPECHQLDTLRWWSENSVEMVECVECGFSEQRLPKSVEQSKQAGGQPVIGIFKPD